MDLPGSIGEWLKARRKALDLTQEELEQRAGCSVFALRKIESGERKPSKQLAGLLAAALEITGENQGKFVRMARGELIPERLPLPLPAVHAVILPASQPVIQHLPLLPTPLLGRDSELADDHRRHPALRRHARHDPSLPAEEGRAVETRCRLVSCLSS